MEFPVREESWKNSPPPKASSFGNQPHFVRMYCLRAISSGFGLHPDSLDTCNILRRNCISSKSSRKVSQQIQYLNWRFTHNFAHGILQSSLALNFVVRHRTRRRHGHEPKRWPRHRASRRKRGVGAQALGVASTRRGFGILDGCCRRSLVGGGGLRRWGRRRRRGGRRTA